MSPQEFTQLKISDHPDSADCAHTQTGNIMDAVSEHKRERQCWKRINSAFFLFASRQVILHWLQNHLRLQIGKLLSSPLICDFSRHLGYESQVSSSINRDVEFVDFGLFLSR